MVQRRSGVNREGSGIIAAALGSHNAGDAPHLADRRVEIAPFIVARIPDQEAGNEANSDNVAHR